MARSQGAKGFRPAMSGLHTWCGLVAGWLLCAIFLTGTLSVFRAPISRWMEAGPVVGAAAMPDPASEARLWQQAITHLQATAPTARFWRIERPAQPASPGDAWLLVTPRPGGGLQRQALDPATGAVGPAGRATEGGRHFMSFHYALHGGTLGFWVVGLLAMAMLVALVSGVVVHRRLFADFFIFRAHKGQRSWMDAHNATAVLALPFQIAIVYTGLAVFYTSYMPWPLQALYGPGAHAQLQAELTQRPPPAKRPATGLAAPTLELAPLLAQAQTLMGRPAHMVLVEQPGDQARAVRILAAAETHTGHLINPVPQVRFDGLTGQVLEQQLPTAAPHSDAPHAVMESLHLVRFGGWPTRWLYFAGGLMGTAMIATGLLLFMRKRRSAHRHEFGAATATVHRSIDVLNVAAIAGSALACITYFWGNRLLPIELAGRTGWEIRIFFAAWAASLLHAALRPRLRAWTEQLAATALLCLGLPLLNAATTGQHLLRYAQAGDWQRAGLELTVLALGGLWAHLAWRAWRAQQPANPAPRRSPRPRPQEAA